MRFAVPVIICVLIISVRCAYEWWVRRREESWENVPLWTHDWGRNELSLADVYDGKGESVELGMGVVRCNIYTGLIVYFDEESGMEVVTHREAPLEVRWRKSTDPVDELVDSGEVKTRRGWKKWRGTEVRIGR